MDWEEVDLGEISTYRKGKINSSDLDEFSYVSTDSMLANKEGITTAVTIPDNTNVNSFYKNDILISNIRPYFKKIWFADKNGGCSNDVLVFPTNNKRVIPKFLYYNLSSDYFFDYMVAGSNGTKMPRGSKDSILKFIINLPPLEIQQKIVNLISNYDDLIQINNKRIKFLESMAEELYKEWFVRLRFPNYQNTKIEDGIPQGWKKKKIESICNVGRGSSPRPITDSKYFENGDIPWLKIADATASFIYIYKTKECVNEYGASFSRKLPKDSLIIAASGTLGFPMFLATECCIHDGWMYFIDLDKSLRIYFYYSLIYLKEYFNNQSYGAAIQNINTNIVKKSTVTIPKKEMLDNFNEIVIPIFDEIQLLQQKNQTLKQTRDLLLPRLLSGKLDIEKLDIN